MNRTTLGCLSMLLTSALITSALVVLPENGEAAVELLPHDVIRITSVDDLVVGENGIIDGKGSSSDPFIIRGWQIGQLNGSSGIEVWDVDTHLRIQGINVSYCNIGVLLNNVSGVSVRDSFFYDNILGVSVQYSDNCRVSGCTFQDNYFAMTITYSDVSRSGNTFINNTQNLIEKKHPWEQGWLGTAVCVVALIPLVIVVSFLIYFRIKNRPKPPPINQA